MPGISAGGCSWPASRSGRTAGSRAGRYQIVFSPCSDRLVHSEDSCLAQQLVAGRTVTCGCAVHIGGHHPGQRDHPGRRGQRHAAFVLEFTLPSGTVFGWPYVEQITPPMVITATSLPAGTAGQAYDGGFTLTGGVPPDNWLIDAGALPPGLTINPSAGQISGTPITAAPSP